MDSAQSLLSSIFERWGSYSIIINLVGLLLAYKVAQALYYISPLHPLYAVPGPKLAAMSYAYEAYYDFWLGGRYTWEIQRMHKQYGHLIRINPHELHCDDAKFMDEIYAGGNRIRDKWQHFVNTSSTGPVATGTFSTVPHEVHRRRRTALARYFSRGQILKLEDEVHSLAQRMVDKMLGMKGQSFDIREAFNCFTADIIAQYAFGEDMGFVDQPGTWQPNFATWTADFFSTIYMMRHIPPMRIMAHMAPVTAKIVGGTLKVVMDQMTIVIPGYIQRAKDEKENRRFFADLIESPHLPVEDKSIYRLTGEGFTLLTAGTETTAAALTGLSYHLLSQPTTLTRLHRSLRDLDPLNLKFTELSSSSQRPYLWAVIQEALRLFPGISGRSARIARDETLVYSSSSSFSFAIPPGTPVGMSSTIQHHDEGTFPDSWSFRPERWLLSPEGEKKEIGEEEEEDMNKMIPNQALDREHMLAFGRGSRSCVGMQLALCELYLAVAALVLRGFPRMRLEDGVGEVDVRYDYDLVVPKPRDGGKNGVRVFVVEG